VADHEHRWQGGEQVGAVTLSRSCLDCGAYEDTGPTVVADQWRHAEVGGSVCWADVPLGNGVVMTACGCATPDPDPASPCAVVECEHDGLATWTHGPSGHPHVPTRCRCGHGLVRA
jgi:hypothetical protein